MFKSGFTVWYNVSNVEETYKFYTEKLGFKGDFWDRDNGMASVHTNTEGCFIGFSQAVEVIPSKYKEKYEQFIEHFKDTTLEQINKISK